MKASYTRRELLKTGSCAGLALLLPFQNYSWAGVSDMLTRSIPSTGEMLPVVGLGTWQTFDVGNSNSKREPLQKVLEDMWKLGGRCIDSSPMYGSSEKVIGDLTATMSGRDDFFYATKVWTTGSDSGKEQMKRSFSRMRRNQMDLIQIHNLVDWKTHVKTLRKMKEEGMIRYWGITHYVDSAHRKMEEIIKAEKPDFAQFNYSIRSRNAERSLFETAMKHGTATIINQPFESGSLFRRTREKQLPEWVKEFQITSWAQYFLKFIISNEAINCVIPGTSKPRHLNDNMQAGFGPLPDKVMRDKMAAYLR